MKRERKEGRNKSEEHLGSKDREKGEEPTALQGTYQRV